MRARTTRWVAGCAAVASFALVAGALALAYVNRDLAPAGLMMWDPSDVFGQVVSLAVPLVGFVLVSRRPANRIGWLFLVAGLAVALQSFSEQYGLRALAAAPGSLPAGRAFAWLSNWIWVIPPPCSPLCSCSSQPGSCAHGGGVRPHGSWAGCSR